MKRVLSTLSNKWPEYLLEILVITMGILGASALNSWKNQNSDSKKEQLMLDGLKTNIIWNIDEVNKRAMRCTEAYNSANRLIELINPQTVSGTNNEIDSLIGNMINFSTYDPTTGTIDEIMNSGQLYIIQNEELKDKLTNWTRMLTDSDKDDEIAMDHMLTFLIPYLAQKTNLSNVPQPNDILLSTKLKPIPSSSFPINNQPMMTSMELESLLSMHALNLMYMVHEYQKIQTYMEETLALIESEIKKEN